MSPFVWLCVVSVWSGVWAGDYLLPGDVSPSHYDLRLAYDVDAAHQFPFYGLVKIDFTAKKSVSKLVLHVQKYQIDQSNMTLTGIEPPTIRGHKLDEKYNLYTLCLSKEMKQNHNYTLIIPFFGNLKEELDGVYVSHYVDKKTGKKEYLIVTQFEAIAARKGFPCFDEPLYKASFSINIAHHQDFTAISNMPIASSTQDNLMEEYWPWDVMNERFQTQKSLFVWNRFEMSVPMSTYLVAFVISKFSSVESPRELSRVKFRIWARDDVINQTLMASEVGPKLLSFYEEWFKIKFPLPKLDMMAIPDFSAGAMENWGLITFKEISLLYDPKQTASWYKENLALVIAHELAHQWFGNLVTMKWWSDLWLNEGFATYMARIGARAIEPGSRTSEMDAANGARVVLTRDGLASSHPVSVELDDPNRISEIFDAISYTKGAALIRMMNMFLGEDVFRHAINKYLIKYSYKNAEQDDLWAELTEASAHYKALSREVTVKEIMDTWTKQTGYPLLTVTRDYTDQSLTITQKRYLTFGSIGPTSASWWVPLNVLCEPEVDNKQGQPIQWLSDKEGVTSELRYEHGAQADQWVLFNADMIALYRVNYDERNWQLLSATLNSANLERIPTLNRVQLLTDALELAWSGRLNYTDALQMVVYLQHENEYLPIQAGLTSLEPIERVLIRTPEHGVYKKFVRKIVKPAYMRSGGLYTRSIRNADDNLAVKKQVLTSSKACSSQLPDCEENSIELFQQWMDVDDPDFNNPIPLDLRGTVYCVALRRGSDDHRRFLLERLKATNVAAMRRVIILALTCTNRMWMLQETLEWTISENALLRPQDGGNIITTMLRSDIGFYPARDFVYSRIEEIHSRFKGLTSQFGNVIKTLVGQSITQKELDEFLAWQEVNAKYLDKIRLSVDQGIESAKVNIGWNNMNKDYVVKLLRRLTDYKEKTLKRNFNKSSYHSLNKYTVCIFFAFLLYL